MKNGRINFVLFLTLISGAIVIARLFLLQVEKGDYYKALAQGLQLNQAANVERGEIYFKGGEALAINMEWNLVFASPLNVNNKEETANILADILSLDQKEVLEKLQKDNLYEVIKKRISDEELNAITGSGLEGIHLAKEKGRYYPQETMASQLVGFVDADKQGRYGLEGYYNDFLQGRSLEIQGKTDIYLTLDYPIQFQAEKLLTKAKENLKIEGGEIIVADPRTGKILALANFPNFNPNLYNEATDLSVFQNSATQKMFEPGSTFKPFTMAAGINEQKITPKTVYVDTGQVKIGSNIIYNYGERVYGERTMTEVLEKSINTGAVFAEQQVGHSLFKRYVEKFGFFRPTGIDIQEIYSENKEFKKGYEFNFATASFGQGLEMTPLQLLKAYCVIANNGKMVKPYVIDKMVTKDKVVETKTETEENSVVSSKTTYQLTAMLVSVIENGYANTAKVPRYYVAGKTGTAQISWAALDQNKKGYSEETWQSFVGFAPAFNPQFVILVKLNNPQAKTAEYSAVPIFQELARYIIDYYQIPPDIE